MSCNKAGGTAVIVSCSEAGGIAVIANIQSSDTITVVIVYQVIYYNQVIL